MIIWLLSGYGTAFAQNITEVDTSGLSGLVVDQYKRPISNVEISVKYSDSKATSDETGGFKIDANVGVTLILKHPDFWVKEITVPKKLKNNVFTVNLKDKKLKDPDTLDVPYGKTIDKESYLGAASTVYSEQLSTSLTGNILGAVVGRVSGLNISQYRGVRNSYTSINVIEDSFIGTLADVSKVGYNDNTQYNFTMRGASSPVVIVDGFQSEMFNLDVESIESVSIQKDALSGMLLGGRSSRGVLYITTKKPVESGFQVSFTGKYGIQEPIKKLTPLPSYQWAYMLNEALSNDGKKGIYTAAEVEAFRNGSNTLAYPNVNWYDEILKKNSTIQSYNLNATGGGKTAQYFVNLGYFTENGLLNEDSRNNYDTNLKYDRYLITSKINVNVLPNLKMGATIIGRIEQGKQPGAGLSSILSDIYTVPNGVYPIYNPNGSYGGTRNYTYNLMAKAVNSGYIEDLARDGWGNIVIDHDMSWLTEGLSARVMGSIASQSRSALMRSKQEPVYVYTPYSDGSGGDYERFGSTNTQENKFRGVSNYQYMYGQVALDYKKVINLSHTIEGNVFADIKEVLDNYQLPERPININAEAKYDYQKKYFAQAAVSRSYLNRYAPGNRWGTFYAFGLGWDISKETFLSQTDWLNKLKLRAVFGRTGNSISSSNYYTWRQQYESGINPVADYSYPQGSDYTSWYNTAALGLIETDNSLSNPNVSWEKANKFNIGFDVDLFNNHLNITADFYRDKYYDLLMIRGKSIELIGLAYPAENVGKNLFKGIDLSITTQNNVGDFNYYVTGNLSVNQSKILFMDEQNVPEEYMRRTGNPVGSRYGLVAEGFFQTREEIANSPVISGFNIVPGDLKYKDMNGDGVIDTFDQTLIGGNKPIVYFGLNLGFEYKGFELSALFQGVYNREIYLPDAGYEFASGFYGSGNNYSQAYEHVLNRWTPETAATALFPRLSTSPAYNNNPNELSNSFWLRSGNYIRLKNLNVAYTLPDSFSRNYLGGVKVKIFVSGQNLWTQAACSLVDPEVIDFRSYPMLRGFNTGINIKF
ncbi:MAG: SusC/RagA family TonB-linked outer membrane protein [Prevotella sp.]|jgi:TonB-linked SusC/RagA family outer membrane protein|nr:SusC/RagA family TonB-linked outer membrane protein [Prevotella sp.]